MNREVMPVAGVLVKRIGVHVVLTMQGRQMFLSAHDAKAIGAALVDVADEAKK
jgi:REP element-mobilizing transposase RayT